MSHFLTLVFIEANIARLGPEAILEETGRLMAPYDLARHKEAADPSVPAYWDAWTVGGRYDGLLRGKLGDLAADGVAPPVAAATSEGNAPAPDGLQPIDMVTLTIGVEENEEFEVRIPDPAGQTPSESDPHWEQRLERNACRARELPTDRVPFAVVTPDGAWHTEGKMGMFGQSFDHDPYWEDRYDELREQYADCLAVVLDCHV